MTWEDQIILVGERRSNEENKACQLLNSEQDM